MDESEIDIRAVFGLLRRQLRLIIVTVVVIVGIAGLATFALTPIYSATALILVDPSRKNLLDPEAQVSNSAADSARVESEVELVRSDNVLMKVTEQMQLVSDEEFGVSLGMTTRLLGMLRLAEPKLPSGEQAVTQVLNKVRDAVSVQRRGLTYLISVQARSESPQRAADLANAVANTYIADQVSSKISNTMASRDILQARIEQARQAIASSEGSFDSFISENIDRIVSESGDGQIEQLRRQIEEISQAREQTVTTANLAQQELASGNWTAVAQTLASSALTELEQQRREIEGNLAAIADSSPAAVDLRAELERIDAQLRETGTNEISALQSTVASQQQNENQLRQNIRTSILNSNLPPEVLTQIYELQQGAALARSQYETLLARAQDLEAQADLQVADSRLVSPALVPASPSFPNPPLIMLLSAIAALGLGVGLAFLYENFIGGFTSEEQAETLLRTKVVSAIPRMKTVRPDQHSFAELLVNSPISSFAESIRRVRAAIDRLARRQPDSKEAIVVMVTSTAPNEGKSTMSLSIARSYALSGKRTLLIDCDLRKPSIHQQIGHEPSVGFLDYLNADAGDTTFGLNDIISRDPLTSATLIVGARRSNVPTDQLIAGPAFQRLIRAARRSFDVIVLDTPPLGPVVDGLYISQHADVVLFVVRWASTPQSEARKAMANLIASKPETTEVLAVLNQQDSNRRAYSTRYGGYYTDE